MWELRIRPTHKVHIPHGVYDGMKLYTVDYKENQFENHIKDFETLNYSILGWLNKHDTHQHYDYAEKLDQDIVDFKKKVVKVQTQDKKDYMREHKKYFKHLQEEALSGRVHWGKLLSEADDDDRNW